MAELAHARGASPCAATMRPRAQPSLLELAIENEVEGVVRESFSALHALVSAETARARDVRSAMASIAVDEASHAALASQIAGWLHSRLSEDDRQKVACARRDAIAEIRRSIDEEPAGALVAELGVPTRSLSIRLLDALGDALWSAQADQTVLEVSGQRRDVRECDRQPLLEALPTV
ncbi:MAG: hypothetical protein RLZZ450_4248 [Pseudomonadota bacterium]